MLGKMFKWTKEQQTALEKSKSAIAEAIILTYPDVFRPFILYTDASIYATGVLLTQENKTIFCFSKKLNPTQQNDIITDK